MITRQDVLDAINEKLIADPPDLVDDIDISDVMKLLLDYTTQVDIEDHVPDWTNALNFNTNGSGAGKYCKHPDTNSKKRIFETKTSGNINNAPPTNPVVTENTHWKEISPSSGAAIPEWAAGVYGAGLVILYHNHTVTGRGLYLLTEGIRPFTSANIETEITAGQWARLHPTVELRDLPTGSSPIIVDMLNVSELMLKGTVAITGIRTWQFVNYTKALRIHSIRFSITGSPVQTMPATLKMRSYQGGWDDGAKTWTPPGTGNYEADVTYDGTTWYMKIEGPF